MHVGIVVNIVPNARHRGVHRPGERVEGFGRVQGYGEHLVLSCHQHAAILGIIVGHHFLPWLPPELPQSTRFSRASAKRWPDDLGTHSREIRPIIWLALLWRAINADRLSGSIKRGRGNTRQGSRAEFEAKQFSLVVASFELLPGCLDWKPGSTRLAQFRCRRAANVASICALSAATARG